jgi:MFS family permease
MRDSLRRLMPRFGGLPTAFWVLFTGTLVNRTGGFVLAFLMVYLTESRGLSAARAGGVVAAYGLGAMAGGPLGGAVSDRIGRRPTLIVSLIAGGSSMLVLGLVSRATAIVAVAFCTGLLYEMYRPVVSATIADVVDAADRPRAYSLIYWAVNIGAAIAPVLGGVIAARSYRMLFAFDAATTIAYGLIVWSALPETRPVAAPASDSEPTTMSALRDGVFLVFCVLTLAFCLVFYQSFTGLPIDMRAHGISTATFGALIALNGLLIMLLQPSAGEWVADRPRGRVLASAALLLGFGFGINAWVGSAAAYAAGIAIWTLGEILFAPAATALVADLAPADLRGQYQGVYAVAFTAAFAVAPPLGGFVITRAGAEALWVGCLVAGCALAGAFLAFGESRAVQSTSRARSSVG